MKFIYILFLSISLAFTMISCKKFVEIEPGTDIIETSDVFSSDKTALSAISGVYAGLVTGNLLMLNGGATIYAGLTSDELIPTNATTTTTPFYENRLLANNTVVYSNFYSNAYKIIYQTNAIIEGVQSSSQLSDSVKKQSTGEMKMVRALLYFYLSNYFGEVPLVLSTNFQLNATLPRTSIPQINAQIIADLIDAKSKLSVAYPSTGKVRPNKAAATALLARVYLYQKDWVNAEIQSSELIGSNQYALLTSASISSVFLKNSAETIWEIASPNEKSPPAEPTIFIPASATVRPTYILSPSLLGSFESGDLRRYGANWIDSNKISNVVYLYPKKFKQRTIATGGVPTEYQIMFRLAEQYLIRAESRAFQNKITESLADLNKIRNRAGLSSVNFVVQALLLSAIEKERQTELFAELGHRWLDLKRTERTDAVLAPLKAPNWQSTDVLFPIPEKELLYNINLIQNPGY